MTGLISPESATQKFKDLLDDLTKVEVNTILKHNIAGSDMPGPREALTELAKEYCAKLLDIDSENGCDGVETACLGATTDLLELYRELQDKSAALGAAIAARLEAAPEELDGRRDRCIAALNMLYRIQTKSKAIADILQEVGDPGAGELALLPEHYMTIRKAWEIGTERILLQTIVQFDGDAVHRIDPVALSSSYGKLLESHQNLVNGALAHWAGLFQVARDFCQAMVKGLRP